MIEENYSTDATLVYRESSALSTLRMDGTGDAGSLLEAIRDTVVVIGAPSDHAPAGKVPASLSGNIDAMHYDRPCTEASGCSSARVSVFALNVR